MQDHQSLQNLANLYHTRWIDCLYFSYYLSIAEMQSGNDSAAVALLHQCVARDLAGQVALRVFGEKNPYRTLWPDKMQGKFDAPVPTCYSKSHSGGINWKLLT